MSSSVGSRWPLWAVVLSGLTAIALFPMGMIPAGIVLVGIGVLGGRGRDERRLFVVLAWLGVLTAGVGVVMAGIVVPVSDGTNATSG